MRKNTWILIALFAIASLSGCKEGDTIVSGFVIPTPSFSSVPPTGTSSDFVTLEPSMTDGQTIVLDLILHDVDKSVSGIAIKLSYPAEFSKFIRCTDGDLFSSGGCLAAEPVDGSGELFIGRFPDKHLDRELFTSLLEAQVVTEDWRIEYNHHRPHGALGDQTPAEFAATCAQAVSAPLQRPGRTMAIEEALT